MTTTTASAFCFKAPAWAFRSRPHNSMPFGYLVTNQPVTKNFPLLFTGHHDQDTDPRTVAPSTK